METTTRRIDRSLRALTRRISVGLYKESSGEVLSLYEQGEKMRPLLYVLSDLLSLEVRKSLVERIDRCAAPELPIEDEEVLEALKKTLPELDKEANFIVHLRGCRYGPGEGFKDERPDMKLLIALNDDFEGGDYHLSSLSNEPVPGEMSLALPRKTTVDSLPVIRGTKYILRAELRPLAIV